MPPKKNVKKKIKKSKKKKPDEVGDDLEKYKRTVLDVEVLKDHLSLRCDVARQAQTVSSELRSEVRELEQKLCYERQNRKDVNAVVSHQYDSMQTSLTAKVKRLEEEGRTLRNQLAQCREELRVERTQREQTQQENTATISELQNRLDSMETDYEKVLHDSLDSLVSQLAAAREGWEDRSSSLHQGYKHTLSDLGLSSLDI